MLGGMLQGVELRVSCTQRGSVRQRVRERPGQSGNGAPLQGTFTLFMLPCDPFTRDKKEGA